MRKKLTTIAVFIPIVAVLGGVFWSRYGDRIGQRVDAVGDLSIIYDGLPLGAPVFEVDNMMPGDCQERVIEVHNGASIPARVAVRTDGVVDADELSDQLSILIVDPTEELYGGTSEINQKTVADFYADSGTEHGVLLSTVPPTSSTSYEFSVCMKPETGNEYQGTGTVFDLVFGELPVTIPLPAECHSLEGIITEVIYGTEGDDNIRGSSASELIFAVGGNNTIRGGGGDDCIVGGPGDDWIDGGSGNDIIIAGGGNNTLRGGSGDDIIYGGPGDDVIDGGSGNDIIYAGGGNNIIDGGRDDDIIYGGPGFDIIYGGSGNDIIYGGEGDSEIYGGSGDDYIDGQGGNNVIDGGSGTDTCLNFSSAVHCQIFP